MEFNIPSHLMARLMPQSVSEAELEQAISAYSIHRESFSQLVHQLKQLSPDAIFALSLYELKQPGVDSFEMSKLIELLSGLVRGKALSQLDDQSMADHLADSMKVDDQTKAQIGGVVSHVGNLLSSQAP
jgi:hypothetical protein